MDSIKVLMVDDESRMRKLVKDFLTREGYMVLEAGDGEQALDIFMNDKNTFSISTVNVQKSIFHMIPAFPFLLQIQAVLSSSGWLSQSQFLHLSPFYTA